MIARWKILDVIYSNRAALSPDFRENSEYCGFFNPQFSPTELHIQDVILGPTQDLCVRLGAGVRQDFDYLIFRVAMRRVHIIQRIGESMDAMFVLSLSNECKCKSTRPMCPAWDADLIMHNELRGKLSSKDQADQVDYGSLQREMKRSMR